MHISLRDRDIQLLHILWETRILSTRHVESLVFNKKREATKKRLQKLKAEDLILESRPRLYEPAILSLTKKSFKLLKDAGHLGQYPNITEAQFSRRTKVSPLTLQHELAIVDVRVALSQALKSHDRFSLEEFSTWPLLNQFKVKQRGKLKDTLVKPDGFIRIHEKSGTGKYEHTYFLELDRGTETLDTLLQKMACYNLYYRTGGFAVKNGARADQFKEYPFQVIFVLNSRKRIENFRKLLRELNPPIISQAILAFSDDIIEDPLRILSTN
jgi:hypothetical protein